MQPSEKPEAIPVLQDISMRPEEARLLMGWAADFFSSFWDTRVQRKIVEISPLFGL